MKIEQIRQVDCSEPDASGVVDYYYEVDIYRFTDGLITFIARSYVDEPDEAHFLAIEINGNRRMLDDADLVHDVCQLAQAHLRSEGKTTLRWLSGNGDGYESVPTGA